MIMGKFYSDSNTDIYCGDCLEIMPNLPKVDMILCDLPYGTTACKWDAIIPFEALWQSYKIVAKDNSAIVLTASQPFTSALIMSNTKMFRYELIWQKDKGSNPLLANKMPLKAHENVIVFYKSLPVYNPQYTFGVPYVKKQGNSTFGEAIANDLKATDKVCADGRRFPISVVKIARDMNRDKTQNHPTQKPVALFEYLIRTYTDEGATILDNCLGSGTTAIACKNTNRKCIGIELSEDYCAMSAARCVAANMGIVR